MTSRRGILKASTLSLLLSLGSNPVRALSGAKLVFVHGRGQAGRKQDEVLQEWMGALTEGAAAAGGVLPTALDVKLPFYGDMLEDFTKKLEVPLVSEIHAKGGPQTDDFLQFQAEIAEEVRVETGVTTKQVDEEYGNNPKQKGPLNWEWVQAIIAAIDKHAVDVSTKALEIVTRDVFMYISYPAIRDAIDEVVRAAITEQPTVMVGHSLGSVVAYSVLQSEKRAINVPLLVTVGCPLAIRAIRRRLTPISFPPQVGAWDNAYDTRDVVALYPLDKDNFDVSPAITNFGKIRNKTDNRHGIVGYLDNPTVANWLIEKL